MSKRDPIPDLTTPEAQREEWLYWLVSTRNSIRQIRRWVGWLVVLVALYIALQLLGGFLWGWFEAVEQPSS